MLIMLQTINMQMHCIAFHHHPCIHVAGIYNRDAAPIHTSNTINQHQFVSDRLVQYHMAMPIPPFDS